MTVAAGERLMKLPEVLETCGIGLKTLTRLTNDGSFPKTLWIGPKGRRWRESEILAWIESLPEERPAE